MLPFLQRQSTCRTVRRAVGMILPLALATYRPPAQTIPLMTAFKKTLSEKVSLE